MKILGIETSCDETSAAFVEDGVIRTNVVASQAEQHAEWGGVVPEVAARMHVEAISGVIEAARQGEIPDAIAVTNRPGLVGALSVGVSAAKALAYAWNRPIVGVHHIEGHILSPFDSVVEPVFPFLSLVVSGGHTELFLVRDFGRYELIAETIDDAAGEAFDKGARLLGLGYPGGRALEDLAQSGNPKRYTLPQGLRHDAHRWSFSGLKTAMKRLVEVEGEKINREDAASSLQRAIVSALVAKVDAALNEHVVAGLSLVGGVAANKALRSAVEQLARRDGLQCFIPPFDRCTDNAAMIALAGAIRLERGEHDGFGFETLATSEL
ncbi:MAG: tRNA (adenosine(37)-N6)-threonylcarbamoyltransferase complex transferase subunit TsaD [Fimbriimonadaceae bacterium]|nr:tRNA (adenosine(37)-N6)-threonylcarbamoyltransferase complex transferase subunit TsaD [Fimbriimonadaceae bacterium]